MKRLAGTLSHLALAAVCAQLAACGAETPSHASLKSAQPVQVTAKAFEPIDTFLGVNYEAVSTSDLRETFKTVLEEKLATVGITPTRVPQFFHADLVADGLEGCQFYSGIHYSYCGREMRFNLTLSVGKGPEELASQAMRVPVETSAPFAANIRTAVRWSVGRLVDSMIADGLLRQIKVETPYF